MNINHSKKSSIPDDDCLCGPYGNCLAHDDNYNKHREPNQPRRVYHKPKYPDEPLYLDKVFFGFIFLAILISIVVFYNTN